jgi:hypothetical protein
MKAYIDESGDEGTKGKGTRWLTFGCVLIPGGTHTIGNAMANTASRKMPVPRPIHFVKLSHADKRGVLATWANMKVVPWAAILVATDTTDILPGSWLDRSDYHYNYALRATIERASQYACIQDERLEIIVEDRRNFSVAKFRRYLTLLKSRNEPRIKWSHLDIRDVSVSTRREHKGLCIADGLAHATFKALEPDDNWGHYERGYLDLVKGRLWKGPANNRVLDNGLLTMPWGERRHHRLEYPWMRDL